MTGVHEERSKSSRSVLGVVDGDLLRVEVIVPVGLAKVDVVAEAFLESAVGAFRLAVGLRMVSRGHGELGSEARPEVSPEVSREARVAVAEDGVGDAVVTNNLAKKEPGEFGRRDRGGGGDVVNHLGELVDEDDDGVVATPGPGKLSDEIHGHLLPRAVGDRERLREAHRCLVAGLVALTRVTADNIP